jgi:hypothetical protein
LPRSAEPSGEERRGGSGAFGERSRTRRERAATVGAPHLVPAVFALLVALGVWAAWGKVSCDAGLHAASPETQVRAALARQHRARIPDVYGFRAGGTVSLSNLRYADVAVNVDGGRAQVIAVVDAEGDVSWREKARLSYVGREAFAMTPCRIALWCGDGRQFARLKGVLATLFRRHDAFNAGDAEAYARLVSDRYAGEGGKAALLARLRDDLGGDARMRVVAWQIRVERDRAVVGEDYEIRVGDAAPAVLRARFELALEGASWRVVSGL